MRSCLPIISRLNVTASVGVILTEITHAAAAVEPLHTNMVSDMNISDCFTDCDYNTGSFVTTDERQLHIEWPVALPGVEIRMTY